MTWRSVMFETCPTCKTEYSTVYDRDSQLSKETAREDLGKAVRRCHHDGVGGAL